MKRVLSSSTSQLLVRSFASQPDVAAVREHLLPPVAKLSDQIVSHGKGSYVWTTDGTKLLDFTGAIGVLSTGYCHPKVVEAVRQQLGLIDRLTEICPSHLSRFFFCNSGSEAVDNAIKIARAATGKQNIIAFKGGYHGRTYGSMAVTSSKTIYRQMYGPLIPGIHITSYPYCLQCDVRRALPTSDYTLGPPVPPLGNPNWTCCNTPLKHLEEMLHMETHPKETAAVIIEPIQGEGGFVTPPHDFLRRLREICDANGMLLIMDEVQAGAGRTGKWWAHSQFEESMPDIMVFAKGICSGYPFAGLATRGDLYDNMQPGSMGGTYGANALGCAAAAATIDAIKEDGMLENAHARGLQLMQGLLDITNAHDFPVIDIRGKGLMCSVEFGGPDGELDAPYGIATEVVKAARKHGLILMTAGARETIRFLPPLNVSAAEVEEGLNKFATACQEVFDERMINRKIVHGKHV